MEEVLRAEWKQLNEDAGWKKVVKNINLRQGEHKGKDTNRMRVAIMHKREDDQT